MTRKSETLLKNITGYALVRIRKYVKWLEPFSTVVNREGEPVILKEIKGVAPNDVHNTQVNDVSITMFQEATELCKLQERGML